MQIGLILYFLLAHFVSEFLFQPSEVFISKGKDIGWLLIHVILYGGIMFVFLLLGMRLFDFCFAMIMKFLFLCGAFHFVIDFFSGSALAGYWATKRMPAMFVTAGAEQFLHFSITILILYWLN